MTNNEMINNMSVEDKAEMFMLCKHGCFGCVAIEICSEKVVDYRPPNCYREIYRWLNEEAEE